MVLSCFQLLPSFDLSTEHIDEINKQFIQTLRSLSHSFAGVTIQDVIQDEAQPIDPSSSQPDAVGSENENQEGLGGHVKDVKRDRRKGNVAVAVLFSHEMAQHPPEQVCYALWSELNSVLSRLVFPPEVSPALSLSYTHTHTLSQLI